MAIACSSCKSGSHRRALWCAAILAAIACRAGAASLTASLVPARTTLYVGEQAVLVLDLDLGDAQLYNEPVDPFDSFFGSSRPRSEPLSVSGLPDDGTVLRFGNFERVSSGASGSIRLAAPVEAVAPGALSLEPAISGTQARTVATRGFLRTYSTERFEAEAGTLALTVAAVPDDARPENFCGAVGDSLRLDASLSPLECAPGDLLELRWTLSGRGAELGAPVAWNPGPGFKTYPPRLESPSDGSITVTQIAIPQDETATNAQPFSVSWFDPASAQFASATAGPWTLAFRPRPEPEPADSFAATGAEQEPVAAPADATSENAAPPSSREDAAITVGGTISFAEQTAARFAPWPRAKVLFRIPAGTKTVVRETSGDHWARILMPGGATGWVEIRP